MPRNQLLSFLIQVRELVLGYFFILFFLAFRKAGWARKAASESEAPSN